HGIRDHGVTGFQTCALPILATNHQVFSSEPTIVLPDPAEDFTLPMFIAMDQPKHDVQRKTVSPIVAGPNLANMEPVIRARAGEILDSLPIGEEFNWVD